MKLLGNTLFPFAVGVFLPMNYDRHLHGVVRQKSDTTFTESVTDRIILRRALDLIFSHPHLLSKLQKHTRTLSIGKVSLITNAITEKALN